MKQFIKKLLTKLFTWTIVVVWFGTIIFYFVVVFVFLPCVIVSEFFKIWK